MEARRAAELHELADNLRAVLSCVVEDGEWAAGVAIAGQAAPGAGAGSRRRAG